jgi:hypothetical protein
VTYESRRGVSSHRPPTQYWEINPLGYISQGHFWRGYARAGLKGGGKTKKTGDSRTLFVEFLEGTTRAPEGVPEIGGECHHTDRLGGHFPRVVARAREPFEKSGVGRVSARRDTYRY